MAETKEFRGLWYQRGISDKSPLISIETIVVAPDGTIKEPREVVPTLSEENYESGDDMLSDMIYDISPEDLVFEVRLVDSDKTDESNRLMILQKPKEITPEMAESIEAILFAYGWPDEEATDFYQELGLISSA